MVYSRKLEEERFRILREAAGPRSPPTPRLGRKTQTDVFDSKGQVHPYPPPEEPTFNVSLGPPAWDSYTRRSSAPPEPLPAATRRPAASPRKRAELRNSDPGPRSIEDTKAPGDAM